MHIVGISQEVSIVKRFLFRVFPKFISKAEEMSYSRAAFSNSSIIFVVEIKAKIKR